MPVDKFGNEIRQRTTTVKSDEGISLNFANKTYIRLDGESDITGNLNMALRKIENLGEPTNPKDATSKEYVDNTKGTGVIGEVKDETATLKGNLDFEDRYRIKNLPAPADWKDAVNMEYVERLAINHPFEFKDNKYQAKTDLYLQGNKIQGVGTPFNDGDVVTKGYVESVSAPLLKLEEGEYKTRGDIDMSKTYTICNIKPPVKDEQITDKKYVDDQINFNSAFSKKNGGYEAKGHIYLRRNKILGLPEPIQPGEPTTKKYVDGIYNNLLNQFVDADDNILPGKNVDMEGNQILNLPEPAADHEPATKKYVDDLQTQHVDQKGNVKFGRNINLDNKRIFAMKEPNKPNEGANKKYVDETITKRIQEEKDTFLPQDAATKNYVDEAIRGIAAGDVLVSKEGVFIKENGHYRATAPLDIDNQKMENVPDPVDETDAVNKKYVDGAVENLKLEEPLVRENGGYNIADAYINMNFNRIRNVAPPKHNEDAVPRSFVDGEINAVKEQFEKRKQLITASASFQGDLIKGEYQFTWGGHTIETQKKHAMFNGFLIPSKGKIKKFVVLDSGFKFYFDRDDTFRQYINRIINQPIDLFSLFIFREKEKPIKFGTLYFMFTEYISIVYSFKYDDSVDVENFYLIEKDIINIRTEFDTTLKQNYNKFSFENINYNLGVLTDNVFTYLATVLIELDSLDD